MHQTRQGRSVLLPAFVRHSVWWLGCHGLLSMRLCSAVHPICRNLDDEIDQCRDKHDFGIFGNCSAVSDTAAEESSFWIFIFVIHSIFADGATAEKNCDEPRESQKHYGTPRKHAYACAHLILRIWPHTRSERHHAIRNRTENGQHDAAHKTCHRWDQQQQLTAIGDQVGRLIENHAVDNGQEEHHH